MLVVVDMHTVFARSTDLVRIDAIGNIQMRLLCTPRL